MTIVELPAVGTDAAIGINSSKVCTHAFDFGLNPPTPINSVALEQGVLGELKEIEIFEDTSAQGFGYRLQDTRWFLPAPQKRFHMEIHKGLDLAKVKEYYDGNSLEMFRDMLCFVGAKEYQDEGIIFKLKGLTPGTPYSARYYYVPWDPPKLRPITL